MFIRFARNYQAGNGRMYRAGEVLDVDRAYGNQLIADGAAVLNTSGDGSVVTARVDPLTGKATGLSANGETNGIFQPSSKYKFFIPGKQFVTSGAAKDKSGKSADAVIASTFTDAAAWANNGYITTVAAAANAGKSLTVPAAKSGVELSTESFIFSAVMNKAAPAANDIIFGNADVASVYGFYLSNRAGGAIRPIFNATGGAVTGLADSTVLFADGTDHVLTLAYDALTKQAFLWRDGALTNTYATGLSGTSVASRGFSIGTSSDSGAGDKVSVDLKTNGIHLLAFTGGLPINIGQIVQQLAGAPLVAITDSQLQF